MLKLVIKLKEESTVDFVETNNANVKQYVRDNDKIIFWIDDVDECVWVSNDSTCVLTIYINDFGYNLFIYENGNVSLYEDISSDELIELPDYEIYGSRGY